MTTRLFGRPASAQHRAGCLQPARVFSLLGLILLLTIVLGTSPTRAAPVPPRPAPHAIPQTGPLAFSPVVNVSNDPQQSYQPVVRPDTLGVTHMVWLNALDGSTPGGLTWEIVYANSADQGQTWGNRKVVATNGSPLSATMQDVAMAVDQQNRVHIIWSERDAKRVQHINYIRRDADGSWHGPVLLAKTIAAKPDPYSTQPRIDIAVDPGATGLIHVVWTGAQGATRGANWAIYYANSLDGTIWANFTQVSTTSRYAELGEPTVLAESGGNVHVAWRGLSEGVEANHGTWNPTAHTMTWQHTVSDRVREKVDSYGHAPALARNPLTGAIYIVYQGFASPGGLSRGIRFATWQNPGWSAPQLIADGTDGAYFAEAPSIAVDGTGKLYVTYDYKDGSVGHGFAYTLSGSGGQTWPNPTSQYGLISTNFSHYGKIRYVPSVGGHPWLYVAFSENIGSPGTSGAPNYDIVFRKAALDGTPTNPAPTISAITPRSGSTTTQTIVRVDGANFQDGVVAKIGTTALTQILVFPNGTGFYATVPAGITLGTYDLVVTNPDGQSATLSQAFTVTP